jgi:hypothetical protein
MPESTFAEIYCQRHNLLATDFENEVLLRTLYPHARLLAPLCQGLDSNHFASDIDLIRAVGRLRRLRDFADEAKDFAHHPANRGFWHTQLRVRVSTKRLRLLVKATLPRGEGGSRAPVAAEDEPTTA